VGEAQVDAPAAYARVDNAKQVMRMLLVALTLDAAPTTIGAAAADTVRAALARTR